VPWFGQKGEASPDPLKEAGNRAAHFVDRLHSFTRQDWATILEAVGRATTANPSLMHNARDEILAKGRETGMQSVAELATKDLDISGLLPPYPRPGQRESMLSVVTLVVTAVLVRPLIDRKLFDAFYQPYARLIPYSEL